MSVHVSIGQYTGLSQHHQSPIVSWFRENSLPNVAGLISTLDFRQQWTPSKRQLLVSLMSAPIKTIEWWIKRTDFFEHRGKMRDSKNTWCQMDLITFLTWLINLTVKRSGLYIDSMWVSSRCLAGSCDTLSNKMERNRLYKSKLNGSKLLNSCIPKCLLMD